MRSPALCDRLGMADDTIVVYLTDNGGSTCKLADNTPLRRDQVHLVGRGNAGSVPRSLAGGGVAGGRRADGVVSSMDLYPSLLAAGCGGIRLRGRRRPGPARPLARSQRISRGDSSPDQRSIPGMPNCTGTSGCSLGRCAPGVGSSARPTGRRRSRSGSWCGEPWARRPAHGRLIADPGETTDLVCGTARDRRRARRGAAWVAERRGLGRAELGVVGRTATSHGREPGGSATPGSRGPVGGHRPRSSTSAAARLDV